MTEPRRSSLTQAAEVATLFVAILAFAVFLFGDNHFGRSRFTDTETASPPDDVAPPSVPAESRAGDSAYLESVLPRRGVPIAGRVDREIRLGERNASSAWTTSFFNYRPHGVGPAGGRVDERLRIGGWGDTYVSLLQFTLPKQGRLVRQAILVLHLDRNDAPHHSTPMVLGNPVTDWRQHITDYFLWRDLPPCDPVAILPAPSGASSTYEIDVTDIVNAWISGRRPNHGISLMPLQSSNDNFNVFYSTRGPAGRGPSLQLTY